MDLRDLEAVLKDRRDRPAPGSYTARLVADPELASRKIMEEAFELCQELGRADGARFDAGRVAAEAADVLYHLLAGLVGVRVELDAVLDELARRRAAAGDVERT